MNYISWLCVQFTTYAAIHVAMALAWCSHDDAKVEGVSSLQEALSRHSTTLVIIAESEQVVHINFVHVRQEPKSLGNTSLSWFGTKDFKLSFKIEHERPDLWKCLQTSPLLELRIVGYQLSLDFCWLHLRLTACCSCFCVAEEIITQTLPASGSRNFALTRGWLERCHWFVGLGHVFGCWGV